ncbi:beta/gamma crystallin-related protein [Vibrio campbellii]|uniref:beta/gamma crystallin-related protein n=1 Tax=Vibrio campbellii TaxID=680 RepID=UPI000CD35503|nr:beta/gamma crystallin-related protein [Vibrio campbellii]AUW07394.1 hypothetical protein C1N51_27440 [Vibrio campbellii]
MKLKLLAMNIGVAVSVISTAPLALDVDESFELYSSTIETQESEGGNLDRESRYIGYHNRSQVRATPRMQGGKCHVLLEQVGNGKLTSLSKNENHALAIAEVSFFDASEQRMVGVENIITLMNRSSSSAPYSVSTTGKMQRDATGCFVTNLIVDGYDYSYAESLHSTESLFYYQNSGLENQVLNEEGVAASVLADIFKFRMDEEFRNIDYNNPLVATAGKNASFQVLVELIDNDDMGIHGANDAGYSIDFIREGSEGNINAFLQSTIIYYAVERGLISRSLNTIEFADILRKKILAGLNQDSTFYYGSDDHFKATIALQESLNTSSALQRSNLDHVKGLLGSEYLLEEFDRLSDKFENAKLRPQPHFENPSDLTLALYDLPVDWKLWEESRVGRVGDYYIYDNPYNQRTDLFRLKTEKYDYFPTDRSSNASWEFLGARAWGEPGKKGDLYYYENPYLNSLDIFMLSGDRYNAYFPTDRTSNDHWTYMETGTASPENKVSPEDSLEFARYAAEYDGAEGYELAAVVLGASDKIKIESETNTIYIEGEKGGLLGKTVAEIAAIAYGVDPENLTRSQVVYTQSAMDALSIDTIYPYGSLRNVKATVYKRLARSASETNMLDQIGTGAEPFILDEMIEKKAEFKKFDIEALVRTSLSRMFKLNGVIKSETDTVQLGEGVKIYEHCSYKGRELIFDDDIPNLSSHGFNDIASSFDIPTGWEVRFYEHANYQGRYWTRKGNGNMPMHDVVSSVRVFKPFEGLTMYEHGEFNGRQLKTTESLPNLTSYLYNFNDMASSFNITDGWEVRFYEHANYQGRYWTRKGSGDLPEHNVISSVKITKKGAPDGLQTVSVGDALYRGLLELEEAREAVRESSSLVAYDNGAPVETVPITDELFARAQLFKYGLNAKMVEDLWKPYLKSGYLRFVSDSRITAYHLRKEREMANSKVQDLWDAHFNSLVDTSSEYLSTLIDYKLKLEGYEPILSRLSTETKLRLVHGMEIDEHINSRYFNGIWNNWRPESKNWVIYGENLDYSINTTNNIYDFMGLSDVTIGQKHAWRESQGTSPWSGNPDMTLYSALNNDQSEKYCSKPNWDYSYSDSPTRRGIPELERIRWNCGLFYITRGGGTDTMKNAYQLIVAEMMRLNKWDLKVVTTDRDILFMVLQAFIPVWGTVESFQRGDKMGSVLGLTGDFMFFVGVGTGIKSALKPSQLLLKRSKHLFGRGVSLAVKGIDDAAGSIIEVDVRLARATAKDVVEAVSKSVLNEMNPISGLGDLVTGVFASKGKKAKNLMCRNRRMNCFL